MPQPIQFHSDSIGSLLIPRVDSEGKIILSPLTTITTSGGSAGTQYTEMTAVSAAVGTMSLGKLDGNTVSALQMFRLASSRPLVTALVDASGAQISSFGGGTQYVESTVTAAPTGTVIFGKQASDTLTTFQFTATKALKVSVIDSTIPTGAATSALQTIGNTYLATLAAAVAGSEVQVDVVAAIPSGNNIIGQVKITNGTDVADISALANSKALHVYVTDALGGQVTNFGQPTEYTEDVSGIADPVGTFPLFIRKDTPAGIVTADGDAIAGRATNYGAQYVQIVNSSGSFVDSFGGNAVGDVAADSADSGNPVKVGFKAKNIGSLITPVTDGDRVNGTADRYGAQFVQPGSSYIRTYNAEYSSAQTNVAMLTAGSGESIRVYGLIINLDYDAQAVTSVAIGFGTASIPTTDGVIFENNGMVPGTYVIPLPVAVCGASGEDLRITSTDPTSGFLNINILYDIIAI